MYERNYVTTESMDLTSNPSKLPRSAEKEIYTGFWDEAKHQHEVGESQIHHEHVGWRSQGFVIAENFQYHHITGDRHDAY